MTDTTMGDTKLYLVAKITAREGMTEELFVRLKEMTQLSRAENGSVFYDLHVDQGDPNTFCFVECWQSRADWDVHMTTDHVKALMADEGRLTAGIDISLLNRL